MSPHLHRAFTSLGIVLALHGFGCDDATPTGEQPIDATAAVLADAGPDQSQPDAQPADAEPVDATTTDAAPDPSRCTPGESNCLDARTIHRCDPSGHWTPQSCPDGAACTESDNGDRCVGACSPNTRVCEGRYLLICDDKGESYDIDELCEGNCVDGACQDVCPPGRASQCALEDAHGPCAVGESVCTEAGEPGPCRPITLPAEETCNGVDDNCNGETDEALAEACQGESAGLCDPGTRRCEAGVWLACDDITPPQNEICNTFDDDCDGTSDEGFDLLSDVDHCGACDQACPDNPGNFRLCDNGACVLSLCRPDWSDCDDDGLCEQPGACGDACDGIDNDRDGQTDEDFVTIDCGEGACRTTNRCEGGAVIACQPLPAAADDATCDGVDDDCDGETDEDYQPETCGTGACQREARCDGGAVVCEPGQPLGPDDTCNGIDDNCDGSTDEAYVAAGCGDGVCRDTATPSQCVAGVERPCVPGDPIAQLDTTCDGVDDNCSGEIDEGYQPERCGVGACRSNAALSQCVAGVEQACQPGQPAAQDGPACDGIDDDCDELLDEDWQHDAVELVVPNPEAGRFARNVARPDGGWWLLWQHTADQEIELQAYDAEGQLEGDVVRLTSDTELNSYRFSAAASGEGLVYCWQDTVDNADTYRCGHWSPGLAPTLTPPVEGVYPWVGSVEGRDVVAVAEPWSDDVYLRSIGDNVLGPATLVGNVRERDTNPRLTPLGAGWLVTWHAFNGLSSARDQRLFGRVVNAEHQPISEQFEVARTTVAGTYRSIALGGADHALVAWENLDPPGVHARLYDTGGSPIGPSVALASPGEAVPREPSIVREANGYRIFWSWVNGAGQVAGMSYRTLSEAGALGPVIDLPFGQGSYENGHQMRQVTQNSTGDILVSWSDANPLRLHAIIIRNVAACDAVNNCAQAVGPEECGVGACRRPSQCEDAQRVCEPGEPAPDDATCDGIDDDCDGQADEDYVVERCGVGACAAVGACIGGRLIECVPGEPHAEVCNGIDDDCDGEVDREDAALPPPVVIARGGAGTASPSVLTTDFAQATVAWHQRENGQVQIKQTVLAPSGEATEILTLPSLGVEPRTLDLARADDGTLAVAAPHRNGPTGFFRADMPAVNLGEPLNGWEGDGHMVAGPGGFWVAVDNRDIRLIDTTGAELGPQVHLAGATSIHMAAAPFGRLAVVWTVSHADGPVALIRFSSNGQGLTLTRFGDQAVYPVIERAGDRFFVFWSSGPGVERALRYAVFGQNGEALQPESGIPGIPNGSDTQLAWTGQALIVVYRVNRQLSFAVIDAEGNLISGPTDLSTPGVATGQQFSVVWTGADAVVSWVEVSDANEVFIQRIHPLCVGLTGCDANDDCPPNVPCVDHQCRPLPEGEFGHNACAEPDDCGDGLACIDGLCLPPDGRVIPLEGDAVRVLDATTFDIPAEVEVEMGDILWIPQAPGGMGRVLETEFIGGAKRAHLQPVTLAAVFAGESVSVETELNLGGLQALDGQSPFGQFLLPAANARKGDEDGVQLEAGPSIAFGRIEFDLGAQAVGARFTLTGGEAALRLRTLIDAEWAPWAIFRGDSPLESLTFEIGYTLDLRYGIEIETFGRIEAVAGHAIGLARVPISSPLPGTIDIGLEFDASLAAEGVFAASSFNRTRRSGGRRIEYRRNQGFQTLNLPDGGSPDQAVLDSDGQLRVVANIGIRPVVQYAIAGLAGPRLSAPSIEVEFAVQRERAFDRIAYLAQVCIGGFINFSIDAFGRGLESPRITIAEACFDTVARFGCLDACDLGVATHCEGGAVVSCGEANDGDGCHDWISTHCEAGSACFNGECVAQCQPNCVNRTCGDDGCGGTCGQCVAVQTCEAGRCVAVCDLEVERRCSGDDAYFYDACGEQGRIADDCTAQEACLNGFCEAACQPNAERRCLGNDAFWYDSCGGLGARADDCQANEYCQGGQCLRCQSNSERQCVGNDVYWFDSCGNQERRLQSCGANAVCQNAQCVVDDPCDGVNCGGHGACQNGACRCDQGYDGDRCAQCAANYEGYPNCVGCTPESERQCLLDGWVWVDSCGNFGQWGGECPNGCQNGICRPDEICNGIDDDGNNVIDDLEACWRPIYRFVNTSQPADRRARCFGTSRQPPASCPNTVLEFDGPAFFLHRQPIAGTVPLYALDRPGFTHILTRGDEPASIRELEGAGFVNRGALGHIWANRNAPPPGTFYRPAAASSPFERNLRRYSHPQAGVHIYANNPNETAPGWNAEGVTGYVWSSRW